MYFWMYWLVAGVYFWYVSKFIVFYSVKGTCGFIVFYSFVGFWGFNIVFSSCFFSIGFIIVDLFMIL